MSNLLQTLFRGDLFAISDVGTQYQRNDIIKQILIARKLDPDGSADSNHGCWRTMYPCEDIDWLLAEVEKLGREAAAFYSQEDPVYRNHNKSVCKIAYWANINQPKSRNVFHAHKPKHFSAVYYLQGKDTGGLRLINPANLLGDCNVKSPFVRDFTFIPNDGDLILWPAWVPHEVEPNYSDTERINLVFDLEFEE